MASKKLNLLEMLTGGEVIAVHITGDVMKIQSVTGTTVQKLTSLSAEVEVNEPPKPAAPAEDEKKSDSKKKK